VAWPIGILAALGQWIVAVIVVGVADETLLWAGETASTVRLKDLSRQPRS
jgi:hypothetical protein